MASKEVMIVRPDEFKNMVLGEGAMDAYKFALEHAGVEMTEEEIPAFISARNAKTAAFRDLNEAMRWMEKTVASIKEVLKHTYNVGTDEELPANVKWNKQSYTYEFKEGAGSAIANALIKKNLVTKEALLDTVTVTAMSKASGVTVDKLVDMFPDTIEQKPKARTLNIK